MKKILSLIIAVVMIMSTMAVSVSAEVTTTLPEAVDGKITLTKDVELADTYRVAAGTTLTLDLNGFVIDGREKCNIAIMSYGNLTVKDSSDAQTGAIKAGKTSGKTGNTINVCGGSFTLESGNIYSVNNALLIDEEAATVNINGGTITAEPETKNSAAMYISSTSDTVVNINDGTIVGYNGILLWNNTTVNMIGGSVSGQGSAGIQGNGSKDNTQINISGGSVSGKWTSIYHPQGGALNISGGSLTGYTGVVIKGGNVTISDGSVTGTGEAQAYSPVSSGYIDTGDALYVEHYDNSTNSENYGTPTVAVTGGTFTSTYGKAVASYANPNNAANGVVALDGFISGGTFNTNVSELVAEGVEFKDNGDGTFGVQAKKVAKVGDTYYDTLTEAMGKFNGRTVEVLCDVEEDIEGFYGVTLVTNVAGGVTITNTNTDWVDFDDVTVGAGVTVEIENPYSGDSENVILGTLVAGDTYYHAYDAKTTIKDGGNVVVKGSTILRYNENTDAGIYIYGDGDDSTIEFDCDYYIGSYSGTLYAENANIEAGYYLLKNSYDNSDYSDMYLTLDNSTITVVGTTDTQDSFIIDDQIQLVLKNGSSIEDVRDFNILTGANLTLSVDSTSSISATYMNIADGVPFEAKENDDGTFGIMNKIEADLRITTAEELIDFAESVNAGNDYSGKTVVLMNDIDMEWTGLPIGTSANPFKGTFDGRNHTISNFTYHHVDETTGVEDDYVGLFGKMLGGTIKNVTLHNPTIEGGSYVAGIVGQGYTGTIDNCHVTGEIGIEGNYMVGGISGQGYAKITNCSVIGDADWDYSIIRATYKEADLEGDKVGGIVGHCAENADVINCTVKNVTIEGTRNVAGIAGNGFENSDFIDCTVENVTIGTNATEDYANANKDSMCIGGIVGIFAKGGYSGGKVSNATVSNVTFTNENNVTVSAGAITGGHRGASKTETPYAPEDIMANNITVSAITGATNGYMIAPDWGTGTDAGFYMVGETKYGMMRFLFAVDVNAEDVTSSGIKYIKVSDITDKVNATGVTVTGNAAAFYGDIIEIPEESAGTYVAVAYVTTKDGTFWSEAVECTTDFETDYTGYSAQ